MKFKKMGVALSGGGGKGAYQIGVWQAMRDFGLDSQLSEIAGTSVGGLNGAMFAQNKLQHARDMWLKIESRDMLSLQDIPGLAAQLTLLVPGNVMSSTISRFISTKGFFKQDGLKSMIAEGLDAGCLASSALPLTVALHNIDANQVDYLRVNDTDTAENMLLGTAALPAIFDDVHVNGNRYSDGGFYWGLPQKNIDNTPLVPLIKSGCDTIVVIFLSPDDLNIDPRHYPGVRILPVIPTHTLGGVTATLDFSNDGAARRMEQGYNDGINLFRNLELFISNEAQYEGLWQRAWLSAKEERKKIEQLGAMDRKYGQTVSDIQNFDRVIRDDDFTQILSVSDEQEKPVGLDQLALENFSLLADIERHQIESDINNFLAQNANNRLNIESAVLDAMSALSPVNGRANHIREQGVIERFYGTIIGKNQKIIAENDRDLAKAQFAALRLISTVQEKGAVTLEFACTLQNRLNGAYAEIHRLGERHNRDLVRVYRSLAGVYSKLRDRLSQHEDRLNALERQGRLHSWLLHPNKIRFSGQTLASLPVYVRLACLVNDFYRVTGGAWSPAELSSLKEMCINVGLGDQENVPVDDFCQHLIQHPESVRIMTERLVILPEAEQQSSQLSCWLRNLRNGSAEPIGNDQALMLWGYSSHISLPVWDFLAELLYHLKAAGFSVENTNDLGRLKAFWSDQLKVLEELVKENILPKSIRNEIVEQRSRINQFHLKVPLVGKFSVGKSTLINCWLGEEVQKTDLGAVTSLATEFHYAEMGAEKLLIHWLDDENSRLKTEERPVSSYQILMKQLESSSILPFYIELHLNRSALARHADLILVDTPGLGSVNGAHERALQQYIGEGVACILCVNRASQVGIDEISFIDRQRSLGQDFSMLVCQEALNTPSQRTILRQQLADQAGLNKDHLVRGCSAIEGELSGFDDLLAHLENRKVDLFHQQLAPLIKQLLVRAERLICQQLQSDTSRDDLLEQRKLLERKRAQLEENYASEHEGLLRDVHGPVSRQVLSAVGEYLRSRRSAYVQMLLASQSIGPLLTADVRNACELAVERSLSPRFTEACQNLGKHIEPGAFESPHLTGQDTAGGKEDTRLGGAAASAAAIAALGFIIPGLGNLVGGLIVGVIGLFTSRGSKSSEAEARANEAIELILCQLNRTLPELLEKQASQFLANMHEKINAQLDEQRENINRIDEQLNTDDERRKEIKKKAEKALKQVDEMLNLKSEIITAGERQ